MLKKTYNSYEKSGVNISAANSFVKHIAKLTKKNDQKRRAKNGLENIGGFGSLFDISKSKIKDPVIVSCTDGVGTKIDLANKFKKFDTIGIDLVAMCVNDLIVQGATPLFFLDYIAVGNLKIKKVKKILKGILKGCKIAKCDLIGGETAEMPGVYEKDKFDLAGFSVGIVSKKKILSKHKVKKGNIILAIPSNGLHSNGFSLVRSIIKKNLIPNKLKKELLKPTKIYVNDILKLIKKNLLNSAAHITGGGLIENIVRSVPNNLTVNLDLSKIKTKKIFSWLKSKNISENEMLKTFNCGVGFCLIVNKNKVNKVKMLFKGISKPYEIGHISKTKEKLKIINNIKW